MYTLYICCFGAPRPEPRLVTLKHNPILYIFCILYILVYIKKCYSEFYVTCVALTSSNTTAFDVSKGYQLL
jgi:hypothetical protein